MWINVYKCMKCGKEMSGTTKPKACWSCRGRNYIKRVRRTQVKKKLWNDAVKWGKKR